MPYTQQPGGKTGIDEVELGRFDEPLVKIAEMGAKQKNYVTRLQYRNPGGSGIVGDAAVGGKGRQIEQLTGPCRAHSDKRWKEERSRTLISCRYILSIQFTMCTASNAELRGASKLGLF